MISGTNRGTRAGVINSCQCVYSTANIASVIGTSPPPERTSLICVSDSKVRISTVSKVGHCTPNYSPPTCESGLLFTCHYHFLQSSILCRRTWYGSLDFLIENVFSRNFRASNTRHEYLFSRRDARSALMVYHQRQTTPQLLQPSSPFLYPLHP